MTIRTKDHWSHNYELQRQSFNADDLVPLLQEVGLSIFIGENNNPRWDLFSLAVNMQGYEPYIALFYIKHLNDETIEYLEEQYTNELNAFILKHENYILFHNPTLAESPYIQPYFSEHQLHAYSPDIVCRTKAIAQCSQDDATYAMKYWKEDFHASNWVHQRLEYWCDNASSTDNVEDFVHWIIEEKNPLFTDALKTFTPSKPDTVLDLLMYLSDEDDVDHYPVCVLAFNALATFSVDDAIKRLKKLSESISLDFSPTISDYCFSTKALEIYIMFMVSQEKMTYADVTGHPLWETIPEDTKKQWYTKCLTDEKFKYQNIPYDIVMSWSKKTLFNIKYSSLRHQISTIENLRSVLSYFKNDNNDPERSRIDAMVSCILLYQTALMLEHTKDPQSKMPMQVVHRYTAQQTKLLLETIPQEIHTWKHQVPIQDPKHMLSLLHRILKNNALDIDEKHLQHLNETTAAMRTLDPQWLWYNTLGNMIVSALENHSPSDPLPDLTP
jgi:hypothetical protein